MDKLTAMKVFLEIARQGSFTAAAEHLEISRAMATKHLAQLENDLGARLLNRTTRRLSLTEVGQAYQDRCQHILAEIEETELAVTQLHSQPRGTLKITAPASFGAFHLAPAAADFMHQYPEVSVDLDLTDRFIDLVEEGMDMGVRVGMLEDSSLIARHLTSTRMVVCGAPSYFEEYGQPHQPDDLRQHRCLVFGYPVSNVHWEFKLEGRAHQVHVNGPLRSNIGDALRMAAIQGTGLIRMPTYIVGKEIRNGRLQTVLEEFEPEPHPIHAVYMHRRHLSAKVRAFVDFLYQRFQPYPYWEDWA